MNTAGQIPRTPAPPLEVGLLLAAGLLLALAPAESRAQPPGGPDATTVRGKIDRFTMAPRGETDGAMLDNGTWLHWPPHMQDRFTGILKEGDRVRATGRTETGPAGDSHFEIRSVTNLRTNNGAENPDFDNGPPPPPPPRGPRGRADRPPPPPPAPSGRADADTRTVRGRIDRFTTAPRGEVDGAVLDDGTVIHWPPHLADRFQGILAKGDRVKVVGWMETGPAGDTHLEVQSVTNLRTNTTRENDVAPPPPPAWLPRRWPSSGRTSWTRTGQPATAPPPHGWEC
jgi:hypothetical protein